MALEPIFYKWEVEESLLLRLGLMLFSLVPMPAYELLVARFVFMPLSGLIELEMPFTESCGSWLETELLFKSIET